MPWDQDQLSLLPATLTLSCLVLFFARNQLSHTFKWFLKPIGNVSVYEKIRSANRNVWFVILVVRIASWGKWHSIACLYSIPLLSLNFDNNMEPPIHCNFCTSQVRSSQSNWTCNWWSKVFERDDCDGVRIATSVQQKQGAVDDGRKC